MQYLCQIFGLFLYYIHHGVENVPNNESLKQFLKRQNVEINGRNIS